MNEAFLCLGGNLSNRAQILDDCITLIEQDCGSIVKRSKLYETEAWGSRSKHKFLNQIVKVKTKLNARQLLKKLLAIEILLGRIRVDPSGKKNADRLIDIDILFFNSDVIKSETLVVPHPRLHLRNFVLKPFMDVDKNFIHPILNKPIKKLFKECADRLTVKEYDPINYICVEGNIGSGKTTLAKELAAELNGKFIPEQFEKNDLLPLFYKDPRGYAFPLEYSFLLNRYTQLKNAFAKQTKLLVSDYSFNKCLWFAELNLNKKDFLFFKKHFAAISLQLPKPDLIIYLKTSVKNLQKNIRSRGRAYENNITAKYLSHIDERYITGIQKLDSPKKLVITIKKYKAGLNKELIKNIKEYLN